MKGIRHKVIIVDDDADDREITKDAFMASFPEADYLTLDNGETLVQYLQQNAAEDHPSLIMLDLNMPGKDGREVLKEIKSNPKLQVIPIIVFTTSSSLRDKNIVYESGANCFITKPDTFNKLLELTKCITNLWLKES